MSTESHWIFSRGRGGSTRSDGLSFNPALKWDGDVDDPPVRVVGEGEEWCWEVRFPGKTGHKVINPYKMGLYTPPVRSKSGLTASTLWLRLTSSQGRLDW